MRLLYSTLLWATRLELAVALAAPVRNSQHVLALLQDEDSYSRALTRLELGL